MTADVYSLANHHHIEFPEDLHLVVQPIRKPAMPVPRADNQDYDLLRFGRTFGATGINGTRVWAH